MKIYVCNAFSLSMLDPKVQLRDPRDRASFGSPRIPTPVHGGDHSPGSLDAARAFITLNQKVAELQRLPLEIISAIGHEDTARLFSRLLDLDLTCNRISVKLNGGLDTTFEKAEIALIGQIEGGRLPPGTTELPEGVTLFWWVV